MTNSIAMPIDAERTLEMTRIYRAPRALVLKMWSDPDLITQWWGPMGFTTETFEMEFRPGGIWRFSMIAPTGESYPNFIRYVETGPDRLVMDHSSDGGQSIDFRFDIALEETEPGRAKMTFRQFHASAEALREKIEKYGAKQGLADTLTRLDALLSERQSAEDPFRLHLWVPSETEIRMSRSFRAPRSLVYEALTREEHICQWQSPYKYRIADCHVDSRTGGSWTMTHVGDDGSSFRFRGTFLEMEPPERFVATFEFDGAPGVVQTNETVLEEVDGVTRMTVISSFPSVQARDAMLQGGMEWGAAQCFDRLESRLMFASDTPRFTVSRFFRAPQDLVWKAWTEADRLGKWWGPKGCAIRVAHLDVQPGGTFHYAMDSERGTMWGRFVYREVRPTSLLSFVNSFSDAEGGLTRAPFSDAWPLEVLILVTLASENGGTRQLMQATPLSDSPAELRMFAEWTDSLAQGFGGTFDQLEEYLAGA